MNWNPEFPYNSLPDLPPQVDLETKEILKLCTKARVALEGLNQAVKLIPNQSLLIYTIPILEARASSEIENIVTTADSLFKYIDKPNSADPATKEALRYRTAMFAGLNSLNNCPLSLRTAREVCSELRGVSVDVRNTPGTYIQNTSTGKVVYTPPVGAEVIRDKMSGWETFINTASELDPLVVMALSHYQFEAIHPFSDGNGRTGRVLNILFLVQNELLTLPVLYLSRYIIKHKSDYYAALNRVTADGDWDGWIKFMLNAVCDTSVWTREKVLGIRRMEEETIVRMHEVQELKKIYSRELVDVIFSLPYVRIQNLIDKGIVQRQAASKYLNILARHGILKEMPSAKEKLFVNTRLLDLLKSE